MMISKKLNTAICEQVGHEFEASLQYVGIATWFDVGNLPRLAAHYYKQAEEEREHAMKLVKYVVDTGGKVMLPALKAPKTTFKNAGEAVGMALEWEKTVTAQINSLMDIAVKEGDYLAQHFLSWFVEEQLEEVTSAERMVSLVQRAGDHGLLLVEHLISTGAAAGPGGD